MSFIMIEKLKQHVKNMIFKVCNLSTVSSFSELTVQRKTPGLGLSGKMHSWLPNTMLMCKLLYTDEAWQIIKHTKSHNNEWLYCLRHKRNLFTWNYFDTFNSTLLSLQSKNRTNGSFKKDTHIHSENFFECIWKCTLMHVAHRLPHGSLLWPLELASLRSLHKKCISYWW